MSQIAVLSAANAIAQLTLPLIKASVLPQQHTQAHTPTLNTTDTVSISPKAAALASQKK